MFRVRVSMAAKPIGRFNFDSPFVRQLEEGFPWLKFGAELEPGFGDAHFERTLPFVRAALYIGLALMVLFFFIGYISGRPVNDWLANLVRFGFLAPAFVAAIVASHIPGQRQAFRTLVMMTAFAIAFGYVVLHLTAPQELWQTGFAGLPVVIAFIYFALGLFMQTAMMIVLVMTVAYVIGALMVGVPADQVALNLGLLIVANFVCGMGSYMLEHAMRSVYLEGQILGEMVERDGLTGLYNRRAFDTYMNQVWAMARRQRKPIAVVMADIDHFKAYNDKHGHQAGDECLKKVAAKVASAARRPLDFAGRYGGEEFILVFYDVGLKDATRIADDLRRSVEGLRMPHRASPTAPNVTVSIGVAVVEPAETGHSPAGVIQLADQSLYEGKKQGRNMVVAEEIAETHIRTGVFKSN
jgi:diguanylate cyclase (GGDEF)-like protein